MKNTHIFVHKNDREHSNKRCKTQILKKCSKGDNDLILNCPIHTYSHVTSRSSVAAYLYFRTNFCVPARTCDFFLLCHCLCLSVSLSLCLSVYVWLCPYVICVVLRNKRSIV